MSQSNVNVVRVAPTSDHLAVTAEDVLHYEKAVLGALLQEPEHIPEVELQMADFFNRKNQVIFKSLQEMDGGSIPIDVITLSKHLENRDLLNAVGGLV
jgi:replicative DNA helicase